MDAATIVRRVRALSGITRKELAELADLAPSTVSRIERAELDPTWGTLSRILNATGYQISGDAVISAGDPTAIAAARSALQPVIEPDLPALSMATGQWISRWVRAGWLSGKADTDGLVSVAVAAGNAAKVARRNVDRRVVLAEDGWRALARKLGNAGFVYAVSGHVAARDNRSTAVSVNPLIYVEDLSRAFQELGLTEAAVGAGVLLIESTGDELVNAEVDGEVCFVSRTQGLLDAFAGPGREPDKAEDTLRHLLAAIA